MCRHTKKAVAEVLLVCEQVRGSHRKFTGAVLDGMM